MFVVVSMKVHKVLVDYGRKNCIALNVDTHKETHMRVNQ